MAEDDDGQFDYRTLTRAQIEYALTHIDEASYPKNFANARAALAARTAGASPEPAPILDEASDAEYTYWVEKFLALLIGAYTAIGLAIDDLAIPYWNHIYWQLRFLHFHGRAAWLPGLALVLLAAIPFFGGLGGSDRLALKPRFRWVFWIALGFLASARSICDLVA